MSSGNPFPANLTDEDLSILTSLTLAPSFSLTRAEFSALCNLSTCEAIDYLIDTGYILLDNATDCISLSFGLFALRNKDLAYSDARCSVFISNVIEKLSKCKYIEHPQQDAILGLMDRIDQLLPESSAYYYAFHLACAGVYCAFGKYWLAINEAVALDQEGTPLPLRIKALMVMAEAYLCMEKPDSVYSCANKARDLYGQLDRSTPNAAALYAEITSYLGWHLILTKDYLRGFLQFQRQMEILFSTEPEISEAVGWAIHNVALSKNCYGDTTTAIEFLDKALEQFAQLNMDFGIASSYSTLSQCYVTLKQYAKALECQQMALELFQYLLGNNHLHTARCYHRLSLIHLALGNRIKAFTCHNEAIHCASSLCFVDIAQRWTDEFYQQCN